MLTVLFVCTGNTCRSPMAEAVARDWINQLREAGHLTEDILVASAGAFAMDGAPPAHEALVALKHAGIAHDGRSKRLTADMIRNATLVLGMTQAHVQAVRDILHTDGGLEPHQGPDIETLAPDNDIADPIGMGQDVYNDVLQTFRDVIPERLAAYFNLPAANAASD